MKISVVIPLYNKEKHIAHTIETVLNQSYSDFELIVIDDGSTDKSAEIVSNIIDDRICLIRGENKGVSIARNIGVDLAKSNYVAFLDADDEWMPNFLEEIYSLICNYPDARLFATALTVHERNGEKYILQFPCLPTDGSQCLIKNYFLSSLHYSPLSSSSVCVEKRTFEDLKGFKCDTKNGEDLDLWCRFALKYQIAYSSKPSAVYRRDSENMASRSMVNPPYFPFLDNYDEKDNLVIKDKSSIEKYILQKQLDAVSASLFVIRNKKTAKSILNKIRFSYHNRKKVMAFMLLALLPQSVIDGIYKVRLRKIKQYDA